MRSFGVILIVIGAVIIYLGWQGKVTPAFQALFGITPTNTGNTVQNTVQTTLNSGITSNTPGAGNLPMYNTPTAGAWGPKS